VNFNQVSAAATSHPNQHSFHVENIPRILLLPFYKIRNHRRTIHIRHLSLYQLPEILWLFLRFQRLLLTRGEPLALATIHYANLESHTLPSRKSRSPTGRRPSRGTTTTIPKAATSFTGGFAPLAVHHSSSAMTRTNSGLFVSGRWMVKLLGVRLSESRTTVCPQSRPSD